MPFKKIRGYLAALAAVVLSAATLPLHAETIVLDDGSVMHGRIGKLEDDIVKFYAERYYALKLQRIRDVRVDDDVADADRAAQQANVDRLLFVINRETYSENLVYDQAARLLSDGQFDELEELASGYLESRARHPHAGWKILSFYNAMAAGLGGRGDYPYEQREALINRWIEEYPESQTARIALMRAYLAHAWARRGSGYIQTVTEEGLADFSALLGKVVEIGDALRAGQVTDPVAYSYLIQAQMGLDADHDLIIALLQEAAQVKPAFHPVYSDALRAVLPKWGGSRELVRYILDELAPAHLGPEQPGHYYLLMNTLMGDIKAEEFPFYGFNWDAIQAGFEAYAEHYYANEYDYHNMAKMAALSGDSEKTLAYLDATTGQWDHFARSVWWNKAALESFRQWAQTPPSSAFVDTFQALKINAAIENPEVWGKLAPGVYRETNLFGETLLHQAAKCNLPVLVANLAPGSDIDSRNWSGTTPLHYAASYNFDRVAEILLDNGADADARLNSGRSNPLHLAAGKGFTRTAEALLARHPELVNAQDLSGNTALIRAVNGEYADTVELLLQAPGVEVDARGYNGYTALHNATLNGDAGIVRQLLAAGAEVNTEDMAFRTALDIARERDYEEIARVLEAAGGTPGPRKLTDEEIATLNGLFQEANAKANEATYEEAIALYRQILQRWELSWDAHYRLGWALWTHAKRPEEAAPHLRRALELNPRHTELYYWTGRVYYQLRDNETAREYFKLYVKLAPDTYNSLDLIKRYSHLLRNGEAPGGTAPTAPSAETQTDIAALDGRLILALAGLLVLCLLWLWLRLRRSKKLSGD